MSYIKNKNEFRPGRIFYHVYGNLKYFGSKNLVAKYICTSFPYENYRGSLKVNCIIEFFDEDKKLYFNTHFYLRDNGIGFDEQLAPYNLNRLFASKDEALDYVKQLKCGVFKDPINADAHRLLSYSIKE